jgi:fructose-1,6-bisphosphatase/inositol monophosphatase family enzyme
MPYSDELQFAIEVARGAGRIALEKWGHVARLTKRHEEAVSEADRACQRYIVAELQQEFPNDGIIGEENEKGDAITFQVRNPRGRNWVIDPIDGTNNYLAGLGVFGVCIGLLDDGYPTLGVVLDVTRGEAYAAARGQGAWLGTRQLQVQQTLLGDNALLMLTSNLLTAEGQVPAFVDRWVAQTNWKLRVLGSAAIEAVHVASGVAHGAITLNGKLWDIAASAAIVLEAGGVVSDPQGNPIFPFDLRNYAGAKIPFLAAGPAAHPELVGEIAR